jgi:hypothetical protein
MVTIGSLVPNGESFLVRFDMKGAWYICQRRDDAQGNIHYIYVGPQALAPMPVPEGMAVAGIPGYPYQIVRVPRRIGNAMELPTGTCIDVKYSGIGPTDLPSNQITYGMYPDPTVITSPPPGLYPLRRITVMFQPDGGIDGVFLNDWAFPPSTTVHFMIGRADKIIANQSALNSSNTHPSTIAMYDPALSNLADPQSLWVSISRSTGNVVTSDNQPPLIDPATASVSQMNIIIGGQPQLVNPTQQSAQATYLAYCRMLATNREQAKTE